MPTMIAALWTRPSTGTLARPPESNLPHLRAGLGRLKARIAGSGLNAAGMKGIFVAPEYYFARPKMGKWSKKGGRFRGRPIEQREKETLQAELIKISNQFPDIVIVPGTIAWRKPLDRGPTEKFKRNKVTGFRTGTAKVGDRRVKNVARLGAAADYTGGARKAAPPLLQEIDQCIAYDDYNMGTIHAGLVVAGATDEDAFWEVVDGVMADQVFLNQLILDAALPANCYTTVPLLSQKGTAAAGAATHMMRNTAYLLYGGRVRFKYNKVGDFHESVGDGSTVFVPGDKLGLTDPIEGVSFGMEICLDHDIGVFSTGFPGGKRAPQIHIVVSDSVQTKTTSMKARNYFLHSSTSAAETSCWNMRPAPTRETALPGTEALDGGTITYWKLTV